MPQGIDQSSTAFFDNLRYSTRYSLIESLFEAASESEPVIGWTEGIVHKTKSTQERTVIILVHPSNHSTASDTGKRRATREVLQVMINCTKFSRFVFAINQHIKISLEGARESTEYESGPFSLVFSGDLAIQYLGGGVCVPDGAVIDTRQGRDYEGACSHREFTASTLSLGNPGGSPPRTPPYKSSPWHTRSPFLSQTSTPSPSKSIYNRRDIDYNDIKEYPPLNSLTEGMLTPLLGKVVSIKTPSTARTGKTYVSLVLADASSDSAKHHFYVNCFIGASSLARDLPTPSPDDVILFKSVRIKRWDESPGLSVSGTVDGNWLDWIVYERASGRVVPADHAASDVMFGHDEGFYADVSAKKVLFKQFLAGL